MSNEKEAQKRELRKKMKLLRTEQRTKEGDGAIAKNFLSLPAIGDKNIFFVYCSFASEADTMPVINALLEKGKTVLLPRVENTDMVAAKYRSDRRKNRYGIEEPTGAAYDKHRIEVTVLPLLAADQKGNRLGYGGGYYDRFLKDTTCLKIGYCYDFQVADKPFTFAEAHDVRLDWLVTDKRIIRIEEN